MKEYPSIPRCNQPPNVVAYSFDKLDGSCLRFLFNRKAGWSRFGTRHRLFDKSDPIFGCAIPLFKNGVAPYIDEVISREGYISGKVWEMVAFCEFHGPNSFAGHHKDDDPKTLTLFDIYIYKRGIIGPEEFVRNFGGLPCGVKLLDHCLIDQEYVRKVKENQLSTPLSEGVVCKWETDVGKSKKLCMMKIKTDEWLNKLKKKYGDDYLEYA